MFSITEVRATECVAAETFAVDYASKEADYMDDLVILEDDEIDGDVYWNSLPSSVV